MSLPPLPEPHFFTVDSPPFGYTADQLREAQRAVAEECVKLCELSAENMAADAAEDVRALALVMRSMYLCAKGE